MRNIAKIASIVFVSMLEVGYAVDCREGLYEKYKAHSAEFIKLKNKCKPLLENVKRLADTYTNRVEYKEYIAIQWQEVVLRFEWEKSEEYKEAKRVYGECDGFLPTECRGSGSSSADAMRDLNDKLKKARRPLVVEIGATCELFLDGVYDIDKAFERIARAEYEYQRRRRGLSGSAPKKPQKSLTPSCVNLVSNLDRCRKGYDTAFDKYMAEYRKALEAAEKALVPLETAFRNSPEVKEYVAECGGITTFADFADKDMKYFSFESNWDWRDLEEEQIISYIQSIIANRP